MVSSTTLRNNLADTLNALTERGYLLVSKRGALVSAVVDLDFFEDLLALANPKYLRSIRQARKDYRQGRAVTHTEVFGDL